MAKKPTPYELRGEIIHLVARWLEKEFPTHFVTTTLLSLGDTMTDEEVLNALENSPGIGHGIDRIQLTGEQLRSIRDSLNMTQTEFGLNLGAARRTVADWEGGKRKIPGTVHEILRLKGWLLI